MNRSSLRPLPLALALAFALGAPALRAQTADPMVFQIAAQPLAEALNDWARQARMQLVVPQGAVAGKAAPAVVGRLGPREALDRLLAGSGLWGRFDGRLVTVEALPARHDAALQAVVVTAQAAPESGSGPLAGYVARRGTTGTKTDALLREVPQSISVVTADEMEDKGAAMFTDALAQTPGVVVNAYGFDLRSQDWIVLRGFDGWATSSYRDGLAQSVGMTFMGAPTEVYGLERVEVLRGPSSVLFGKGDAGGIVNRVSKLPSADAGREIAVQTGRYGRRQLAADVGGALGAGDLRWRLAGLGLDTGTQETYPDGTRLTQQRAYLAPSLAWTPTARTTLTLQAEHLRDDASDDVQYESDIHGLPTRLKDGDPTYSRIKTASDTLGYQFTHAFDAGWTLRHKLRLGYRTMDKHHIVSWLNGDGSVLERMARHDVESVHETAVDTTAGATLHAGAVAHAVLLGVDYGRSRAEWRRAQDMAPGLDTRQPVYGIAIPEPVTPAADTRFTSTQLGLYAQDQVTFGAGWGLTLGLRHDRVRSATDDRLGAQTARQSDARTTGRAGLTYRIHPDWTPYASYASSFVPNVGVDAAGSAFVPSTARQFELGVKYLPEGVPTVFTAAVFDLEKTHVVTYDPATYDARQIGKVRSRGLELEAKSDLTPRLRLAASFALLDMQVLASADPGEVGRMPILTPRRTASLWLDYRLPGVLPGLAVGGGLRHTGRRWNDAANTSSEPAYTLWDAAVRYDAGPWRLALNVANLFNRQYYAGRAYGAYYRGAERSVLLTARYRF